MNYIPLCKKHTERWKSDIKVGEACVPDCGGCVCPQLDPDNFEILMSTDRQNYQFSQWQGTFVGYNDIAFLVFVRWGLPILNRFRKWR